MKLTKRKISSDRKSYLTLNPNCSLKWLEKPHVYNKAMDELYELDEEAMQFLQNNQTIKKSTIDSSCRDFIDYCIEEGIFLPRNTTMLSRKFPIDVEYHASTPSLRYLLLHMTERCNLQCKHCYVAPLNNQSLRFEEVVDIFQQMEKVQGLIVLLSGGEPLCHPEFWKVNEVLPDFNLRFEMLSNGTLITLEAARQLNVHHVQVSIDGLEESHDFIRGKGNFQKALTGIKNLLEAGKKVSISTMVFTKNLQDFNAMASLWNDLGISQWLVNTPSAVGSWVNFKDLSVPVETVAKYIVQYSRGEGPYKSDFDHICGSHICTVLANGEIYPCPLIADNDTKMGSIMREGLQESWKNKKEMSLNLTECRNCKYKEECKGGCRSRAKEYGNPCGRDPILCAVFKMEEK